MGDRSIIILDDKDFIFSKSEMNKIVDLHNDGLHFDMIASQIKRDPVEIILCLLHVANDGKKEIRPLSHAAKPKTQELTGMLNTNLILSAKVLKTKNKKPTVIEIDGNRYVLDHNDSYK